MTWEKNQSFLLRLRFALHGIAHALASENSLKFQGATFVLLLAVLLLVRPAPVWWALTILSSSSVLAAELFNTALEQLVDYLQPEIHPHIKAFKDCAAAAVLLTVCGAVAVGIAFVVDVFHLGPS